MTKNNNESTNSDFDALVSSAIIIGHLDYTDDVSDLSAYENVYESKEHLRNIFASSVSSLVSRAFCQPFEVIKQQMALQHVPKQKLATAEDVAAHREYRRLRTVGSTFQLLYATKGPFYFWRGHSIAQLGNLLQTVTLFWTYEELRVHMSFTPILAHRPNWSNFFAGCLSGGVVILISHPVEIIKAREAAQRRLERKLAAAKAVREMVVTGGWRAFYGGVTPVLVHVMPLFGFKFLFYNALCNYALESANLSRHTELEFLSLVTAGAVTGMAANVIVYPLDLIKQRMRLTPGERQRYKFDSTCRRLGQCWRMVIQREGIAGLYNGLVPCLLRAGVSTAVQFAVFDKMRDREFDFL